MNILFRSLPSVSRILDDISHYISMCKGKPFLSEVPQSLITDLINEHLAHLRILIKKQEITNIDEIKEYCETSYLYRLFEEKLSSRLEHVINGTGVVIHTNLGRSPLSEASIKAINATARTYSTLEFDKHTGERGSRHSIIRDLLIRITKAEDAIVVNNNAAAVMLVLDSLAKDGETVISRGELVEVGGSFRIPDVMECSGSFLKEVGTTNKTHANDYIKAINENTKAIMRVHTSNFRLIGFTSHVSTDELADIAHKHDLPFIEDLGSGSFIDFSAFGLPKEPTVQEVVFQDADVVTFSGDKLLGGPQAGIIVGKKIYIEKIRKNQLLRALRPCKLTFAALEATLKAYLNPQKALDEIPTLSMLTIKEMKIQQEARRLAKLIKMVLPSESVCISLKKDSSRVGGGAFPEAFLPTTLIKIIPQQSSAQNLKVSLLTTVPPLIGRLEENAFALDVRTIKPEQYSTVVSLIKSILAPDYISPNL